MDLDVLLVFVFPFIFKLSALSLMLNPICPPATMGGGKRRCKPILSLAVNVYLSKHFQVCGINKVILLLEPLISNIFDIYSSTLGSLQWKPHKSQIERAAEVPAIKYVSFTALSSQPGFHPNSYHPLFHYC